MSKFFYPLIENPYRRKDINEGIKVLKSGKLTIGSKTEVFQKAFCKKIKTKNALLVNSWLFSKFTCITMFDKSLQEKKT
jgi:CDP-6-deoxy-D-xylo-4-hexulose-3-dehydrase